jgi:CPA1 family monovalent cation:H+ antiporter
LSFALRLVLLFAVATAVAIATRRVRVPYTVALVLAGLGLGATGLGGDVHLTKDLLYAVFLPGLIFEAAYNLTLKEIRDNARAILGLAVPGVIVSMGATAWILVSASATSFAPAFSWPVALVFSALIAATDPIAVVALFKTLGAPRRLSVLVEGESIVNDGTAAVLFGIVLAAAAGGVHLDVTRAAVDFLIVVGAGGAIGGVVGFVTESLRKRVGEPMLEIALTSLAAYGSFAIAEQGRASGIIATLVAGLVCRRFAPEVSREPRAEKFTEQQRGRGGEIVVESFWEYVAFALNSVVFLLIGMEVKVSLLLAAWRPIALAWMAMTLARVLVVFLGAFALRPTRERIPWRFASVLVWGGLRGALSMVLALAIPRDFPQRELIVTTTYGVVLLSIVLQGMTAGPLVRALGLAKRAEGSAAA